MKSHWATWFGNWLGLDGVRSIEQVRPSFAAGWAQHGIGWLVFGCAALAFLALVFYTRYQPVKRFGAKGLFAIARAALLVLLLLVMAEPVLQIKLTSSPKPLLWLLVDGTDSMAIQDDLPDAERKAVEKAVGFKPDSTGSSSANSNSANSNSAKTKITRAELVQSLLKKPDDNLLKKLGEKYRLRAFVFDRPDGVRALDLGKDSSSLDTEKLAGQVTTKGQVTAIGAALNDLSRRNPTNLAGVVVLSDFDQNAGPAPLSAARDLGAPIYTVGVGPAAAVDLGIDLQAPLLLKKEERSTIVASLKQSGLDGRSVTVRLAAHRLGGADTAPEVIEIGQQQVQLDGPAASTEFAFTPSVTGRFELRADVDPQEGEVVEQNNHATREINIRDDFLRLMYVEYEPTWEWRFIKEVFHRDKLVGFRGFRTFLRSADPKVRQTNELFLPTLTPKRSDFFANDVIFLGDMPQSTLSTHFCEMTKEFVSTFGGGLVIVAGPRFGPGQLSGTALADMLPVVVDADLRVRADREFNLRLAPAAQQVDFMQLGTGQSESSQAWGNLGRLPWYQPVLRPHPLATVLAEHPIDKCVDGTTSQPIIAIRRYGRGEVVYVGFNETWRLRRKYGELYYRQFWGQMIHRLGLSHALGAQKRFVVRTDRQQYQADDKVAVTVEAYNENFEPLTAADLPDHKLTAELIVPAGSGGEKSQPLTIAELRDGVFEAHVPVFVGGEHRIRVKDPITKEDTVVNFQVTALSAERRSAVRNVALQREIAQVSGGKSYDLTTVASLADDIHWMPKTETEIRVKELWNTWLCFGVITLLMLGEWFARKLVNLP